MCPKDFYDRLLIEIERKGLKPSEFSDKLGFSRTFIYNFKKAYPTVDNLLKISDFLGVSADYLLGRTTQRKVADDVKNQLIECDTKLVEFINYINDNYTKKGDNSSI